MPPAPGFPDIANQHPCQEIISRAYQFENRIACNRNDYTAHKLIGIFHRRCRWISQNKEGEKHRCLQVWRAENLGEFPCIAEIRCDCEKQEVASEKNEHQRNFVDAVRDEYARREKGHQSERYSPGGCAPPVL